MEIQMKQVMMIMKKVNIHQSMNLKNLLINQNNPLGRTDLDVSLQTNQRQHQQRKYSHLRNEINSYPSSLNQYRSIISSKI
jgi:hypothetical protein